MEDEVDAILSQYEKRPLSCESTNFDLSVNVGPTSRSRAFELLRAHPPCFQLHPATLSSATASSRFQTLVTDADVEKAKMKAVPHNTHKNTSWALNIWKQWSANRR